MDSSIRLRETSQQSSLVARRARIAEYGRRWKAPSHHQELALAVFTSSHDQGQLVGENSGQRRQIAVGVRTLDQAGDLTGTVNWLTTQVFVDPLKIALIGWGTGGTAVMRILDPVLPVNKRGAADKLALPGPCKELAARWGSPFTAYPGAYHNFDALRRANTPFHSPSSIPITRLRCANCWPRERSKS